ncbi:unnamed protein product [Adineta steineri]|uniref:Uncharacterized protein n=1 Tax=Adineta steineri TaxID=433720 RepID=A0A815ZM66_9BILA|nr:unnamed protein product [Adineta steineri]CAF1675577.1 unnamed protein product [Adineta steineri]
MSNLEKLTLNISIYDQNRVIDVIGGTYVQRDILDYMLQLHSFTFYICTYVDPATLSYKLSNADIRQTLTNIGLQHVSSMVNYCTSIVNYVYGIRAACSIFSLPFEFDYIRDLGNNLPNIVFSYVTYLLIHDVIRFKHEFFMRIARSFPLLKHLCVWNKKPQELGGLVTFSSNNCQFQSIIKYPHLTILDVKFAHSDYVEQFLNETKTLVPCLSELEVFVNHLKAVTKDFTREDLYARIKVSNKDETIHVEMIGVIQSISVDFLLTKKTKLMKVSFLKKGVCTVHFPDKDRHVVILIEQMELVTPKQNDKVIR